MRAWTPPLIGLTLVVGLACDGKKAHPPRTSNVRPGVTEVIAPDPAQVVQGLTLYVPVYSQVYTADNAQPVNLAATLFVRNVDQSRPIVLKRVEYFDSGGKSIRSFVKTPLKIEPRASLDFFVEESDETGGASPSFVVEWVATEEVELPVVESVMIGTTGSQGISFTSPGRVLNRCQP